MTLHIGRQQAMTMSVTMCEQCRVAFNQSNTVVVKSVEVRQRTNKYGKIVKYTGNLHLHFLTKCFKEYDLNFTFKAVTVSTRTLGFLPTGSKEKLLEKGLRVEK